MDFLCGVVAAGMRHKWPVHTLVGDSHIHEQRPLRWAMHSEVSSAKVAERCTLRRAMYT